MANEFELTVRPARPERVEGAMAGHEESARTLNAAEVAAMARAQIAARGLESGAEDAALPEPQNPNLDPRPSNPETGWPITRPNIPGAELGESPLMTVFRQARTEIGGWGTQTQNEDVESPLVYTDPLPTILQGTRRFGPNIGEQTAPLSEILSTERHDEGVAETAGYIEAHESSDIQFESNNLEEPPAEERCRCLGLYMFKVVQGEVIGSIQNSPEINECEYLIEKNEARRVSDVNKHSYCMFILSTTGFDTKLHRVVFRVEQIRGQPKDLINLSWEGNTPDTEKPRARAMVGAVVPCDDYKWGRVWLRTYTEADATEENLRRDATSDNTPIRWRTERVAKGEVKQGECWIVAYFDGVECDRKLVRVTGLGNRVCSLELAGQKASRLQDAAMAGSGLKYSLSTEGPFRISASDFERQTAQAQQSGSAVAVKRGRGVKALLLVNIRIGELQIAETFDADDCCCKYVKSLQIGVTVRSVFVGPPASPYAEDMKQLTKMLMSPAWRTSIKDAVRPLLPKCRRLSQTACANWKLDEGALKRSIAMALQAALRLAYKDMALPEPPVDSRGRRLTTSDVQYKAVSTWDAEGAMARACTGDWLQIKTLRIQAFICSAKDAATKARMRTEFADALKKASNILMQCCIRLDPADIAESAITEPQRWNPNDDDFAGVAPPSSPYRTRVILFDPGLPWIPDGGEGGLGEAPEVVMYSSGRVEFGGYGGRVAIASAGARLIAHEIGHNAGLATPTSGAPRNDVHVGYRSDEHVMGSSEDDNPPVDEDSANAGLTWKPDDCRTLRRFVDKLPPIWAPHRI